jgi:cytochrome P450
MMGPGIISSDGIVWERARAMIRPAFTRTEIADREMFDVHVEKFLHLVEKKAEMVDLQPLFDRLV